MSKNRNRAKYNKALNNKEYNIIMKNDGLYCRICARRGGGYNYSCAPSVYKEKGWRWRMNRSWKNYRKKQYK